MKKFIKLGKYGQLYMDKILFESYFPVVFTCINEKKDIFIGVCCQNNEKGCKWLLGKTNAGSIVKMLRNKITIRQLLLDYSSGKISVDYAGNEYSISFNNSDWDEKSPYLPKEDSYMYAEDGEFENEINYFMRLDDHIHYNAKYYECVSGTLNEIHKGIESAAEEMPLFITAVENVSKEMVVSTLKIFGELCVNFATDTGKYANQKNYKELRSVTCSKVPEDLSVIIDSDDDIYADAA